MWARINAKLQTFLAKWGRKKTMSRHAAEPLPIDASTAWAEIEEPQNIKVFNVVSGIILAKLYGDFPHATDIIFSDIRKDVGQICSAIWGDDEEGREYGMAGVLQVSAACQFLEQEGFMRSLGMAADNDRFHSATLTLTGLARLGRMPSGFVNQRIGSALISASKAKDWLTVFFGVRELFDGAGK